jgi:hypothetical protein
MHNGPRQSPSGFLINEALGDRLRPICTIVHFKT